MVWKYRTIGGGFKYCSHIVVIWRCAYIGNERMNPHPKHAQLHFTSLLSAIFGPFSPLSKQPVGETITFGNHDQHCFRYP